MKMHTCPGTWQTGCPICRPASYTPAAVDMAVEIALAAQEQGKITRSGPRCLRCNRAATMSASMGPACPDHYDDLSG